MNISLLIVGVSSGLSHSIYSAISKSLLKHRIREPFLFFVCISILQAIITPCLWLFVKPAVPPMAGWTHLLLAGITGVIAFLFLYTALSNGDASSVMPIMGSKIIFASFLATFFLNEKHNWAIYFAAILELILSNFPGSFHLASYNLIWDCEWSGYSQYPGIHQRYFYCHHKRSPSAAWKYFARNADQANIFFMTCGIKPDNNLHLDYIEQEIYK